jgi:hypothetical protein
MKTQKKKISAFLMIAVMMLIFSSISCDKQPKCGCDGDVRFELTKQRVKLFYDKETKYTYFISDYPYSYFTLCNVGEMWDEIIKFKTEGVVLISGKAFDDCMKQVSMYAYSNYDFFLEKIEKDPMSIKK